MPRTIRQTLLARLQTSTTLADLRADFEAMAGLRLRLVGPAGKSTEATVACSDNPLCQQVRALPQGTAHCRRLTEGLVIRSQRGDPACGQCDAGLTSFCVPLKMAGETLGYLFAGGYRLGDTGPFTRNRVRHLLTRLGVKDEAAAVDAFVNETMPMPEARHAALQRWLHLAADALIRSLELREDATQRPLPTFVTKICTVIQRRYQDPPSLPEAAEICGLSEGYFCRAFHEFTGLRFVEYIHAVRIERVCELLLNSDLSITDAAFACGFQSLSQFNRVFRNLRGTSPRAWRQAQRLEKASVAARVPTGHPQPALPHR